MRSRIPATQQDVEIASHVHKQLAVVELLPLRLGPRPRGDDEWARLEAELRGALDGVEVREGEAARRGEARRRADAARRRTCSARRRR